MLKTIILLIWTSTAFSFNSFGQQRIGIDVSTQLINFRLTAHYQKVIKNRVLFSVGIFGGGNGRAYVENDTMLLYSTYPPKSPYQSVNQYYSDSTGTYSIFDYRTTARSIGIQAGIGYFHEFDVQHGLRFNLNGAIAYTDAQVSGYYHSTENFKNVFDIRHAKHWFASLSLEAYHTIRLTGRLTFNYGFKVPFNFSIDRAKFNPTTYKDLLYGFEPQLSIGMTRVIGKCD